MLLRRGPRTHVPAGLLGALCVLGLTVAAAVPAQATGLPTAPVAPVLHFTDGAIAYSCLGYNGAHGVDGWVTAHPDGTFLRFVRWTAGPYVSGVQWSPDGSEMVHVAATAPAAVPTVSVSEDGGTYPWQVGSTAMATGATIADPVFTADGTHILFTRTAGGPSRIQEVAAAGSDPPVDLVGQPAGANSQPTVDPVGDIAFVNVPTTGPDTGVASIWLLPSGTTTPTKLADGSHPQIATDGSFIAFVAPDGMHLQTMNPDGTSVTTTGPAFAQPIDDVALSPDLSTPEVVVSSGGAVVKAALAPGALSSPWGGAECTDGATDVAWQGLPTAKDKVTRVYGLTRQQTAIAISQLSFPTADSAGAVVLVDSQNFPDALSATPLAAFLHGPLLSTPGTGAAPQPVVLAEIKRVLPAHGKVVLVGGPLSISAGIQQALVNDPDHFTVVRIAGASRYATSLAVAQYLTDANGEAPRELLLATGTDYPDGLSAGAAAASYWVGGGDHGGAVLLSQGTVVPPDTAAFMQADVAAHPDPAEAVTVTTVGGLATAAYPTAVPGSQRIACLGADRYATSACVARVHFGAQPILTIVAGDDFPDALAGGVLAGTRNAPLLLSPKRLSLLTDQGATAQWLHVTSPAVVQAYAFGGPLAIGGQVNQLRSIVGVDAGFSTFP
jgi:putative cell wall-binding protein